MGVVEEVFSGLIAGHKKAGLQNKPGTIKDKPAPTMIGSTTLDQRTPEARRAEGV